MSREYTVTQADLDEYEKRVQEYLKKPLVEETRLQWNYGLEVLPPIGWTTHEGMEVFMVSEPIIEDVFTQHVKVKGCVHPEVRYFTRNARLRDKTTWVTRAEVDKYIAAGDEYGYRKTSQLVILGAICDGKHITEEREELAEKIAIALGMSSKLKE